MEGNPGGRSIFAQTTQASQPNPAYQDLSVVWNKVLQFSPSDWGIATGSYGLATANFAWSPVFVEGFGHRLIIDSKTSDCSIKIFELENILSLTMTKNELFCFALFSFPIIQMTTEKNCSWISSQAKLRKEFIILDEK
jgi:hypothetical protein